MTRGRRVADTSASDGRDERAGRIVIRGISVAPGLAVGLAVFHDEDVDVPVLAIRSDDVVAEKRRLDAALETARKLLADVEASIEREVGRRDARIFSVQGLLLEDPSFRDAIHGRIESELVNAEVAVRDAVAAWSARLSGVSSGGERDPVADLRDVGRQLQRVLAGRPRTSVAALEGEVRHEKAILVTRELLPSDTAHLDRTRLAAIVTASGGIASHAAILARGLGIPAVTDVDVGSLPGRGGPWIVDGNRGEVVLNPSETDLLDARDRSARDLASRAELIAHTRGFARTADDVAIELLLNVENFAEIPADLMEDLQGIGLFRTEFLFMERQAFPSEEEQFAHYRTALQRIGDKEITFRTIDVGGDKPLSYLSVPHEPNPVLGWRGLRLSLQWPDVFYTQLRALLRASAYGRMRVMLPMVTMVEEFLRARKIFEEIKSDLARHGEDVDPNVPFGAMIEVPAAAFSARNLAREADFLSIGTNDLSQYALAVDRNNARVANLYQPLHPGVLGLVRTAIEACGAAETPVSVCGEMAGDPQAALMLLGMGLRSFSMSPYHLPLVRKLLRSVRLPEARRVAQEVLTLGSTTEICAALRRHTLRLVPEFEPLLAPPMAP